MLESYQSISVVFGVLCDISQSVDPSSVEIMSMLTKAKIKTKNPTQLVNGEAHSALVNNVTVFCICQSLPAQMDTSISPSIGSQILANGLLIAHLQLDKMLSSERLQSQWNLH